MRRTGKRLGALLLALVMVLSLLPMSALAARAEDDELTIAAPESGNAAAQTAELPTGAEDGPAELLAEGDPINLLRPNGTAVSVTANPENDTSNIGRLNDGNGDATWSSTALKNGTSGNDSDEQTTVNVTFDRGENAATVESLTSIKVAYDDKKNWPIAYVVETADTNNDSTTWTQIASVTRSSKDATFSSAVSDSTWKSDRTIENASEVADIITSTTNPALASNVTVGRYIRFSFQKINWPAAMSYLTLKELEVNGTTTTSDTPSEALTDASDSSRDVGVTGGTYNNENQCAVNAWAASQQGGTGNEGPASLAVDGSDSTMWHTNWTTSDGGEASSTPSTDTLGPNKNKVSGDLENRWIQLDITESDGAAQWLSGLRYLGRDNDNGGSVTKCEIRVSTDGINWAKVTSNDEWTIKTDEASWKYKAFDYPVKVSHVRLYGVATTAYSPQNGYVVAKEIRLVKAAQSPATRSVTVTVKDETTNSPIEGATVFAVGAATAKTDSNGQAVFSDLTTQGYTITATKDTYNVVTATVAEGSDNATVEIAIGVKNRTITGKVVDGEGNGVAGTKVTLVSNTAQVTAVANSPEATTSSEEGHVGEFTINANDLAAGTYKVRASKAGYSAAISGGNTVDQGTVTIEATAATQTRALAENLTLTAIDTAAAKYGWNFDDGEGGTKPADGVLTLGSGVTQDNLYVDDQLQLAWSASNRANNLVRIAKTNAKNCVVEFDATRKSGAEDRFGLGVRMHGESGSEYWVYVGQFASTTAWGAEIYKGSSSAGWSADQSGPSFKVNETRHFKITLNENKVTLEVDGVTPINDQVITDFCTASESRNTTLVPDSELLVAGDVGFLYGNTGNSASTVSIDNLYVFRNDPSNRVTWTDPSEGTITAKYTENGEDHTITSGEGDGINAGNTVTVTGAGQNGKVLDSLTFTKTTGNAALTEEEQTALQLTWVEENVFTFKMPNFAVTLAGTFLDKVPEFVTITGDLHEGEQLTAHVKATAEGTDIASGLNYKWYHETNAQQGTPTQPEADADVWTACADGNGQGTATKTLQGNDSGKYVKVEVTGDGTTYAAHSKVAVVSDSTVGAAYVQVQSVVITRETIRMIMNGNGSSSDDTDPANTVVSAATTDLTATVNPAGATLTNGSAKWEVINEKDAAGAATTGVVTLGTGTLDNNVFTMPITAAKNGTATVKVTVTSQNNTTTTDEVAITVVSKVKTIDVKNGEQTVNTENPLTLYANTGDAGHSKTLTVTVNTDASNPAINWSRKNGPEGLGTIVRNDDGSITLSATNDPAKVGQVIIQGVADDGYGTTYEFPVRIVRKLANTVTIGGTLQATKELEVDISQLTVNTGASGKGGLTYTWYRANTANADVASATQIHTGTGETGKKYTAAAADVTSEASPVYLFAVVSANAGDATDFYYEGSVRTADVQISKQPAPAAPQGLDTTEPSSEGGNVTVTGLQNGVSYEYRENGTDTWADLSAETTLVSGKTYDVRIKENETTNASQIFSLVTKVFNDTRPTITVTAGNNGNANAPARAAAGTTVTLTITPNTGYEVDAVTVTSGSESVEYADVADSNNKTFTMPSGNVTINVTFKRIQITITHALTNITCSLTHAEGETTHKVNYGEELSITLTPDAGYGLPEASQIKVKKTGTEDVFGGATKSGNTISFAEGVLTENITITATATANEYTVQYGGMQGLTAPENEAPRKANHDAVYNGKIVASSGYHLPASITVTTNGQTLALTTDYTYNSTTGAIQILAGKIKGNVVITANAEHDMTEITGVSIDTPSSLEVGTRLSTTVTPAGAHVSYQWQVGDSATGSFTDISGANEASYTLAVDPSKYVRVKVTGNQSEYYSGTKESAAVGPVVAATISVSAVSLDKTAHTMKFNESVTLNATVEPDNATNKAVTWDITEGSDVVDIAANGAACTVTTKKTGTAKVRVTSVDGNKTAICTITVNAGTFTAAIEGIAQAGQTLTAKTTPSDVTVRSYTWYRVDGEDHETQIDDASGSTYIPQDDTDVGYKIRVKVEAGDTNYTGTEPATTTTAIVSSGTVLPSYTVTVNPAENGSVTADKTSAKQGETVTLTVTPDSGYKLDTLAVKDADNADVEVSNNTFTMPGKNVTVSATFVTDSEPTPIKPKIKLSASPASLPTAGGDVVLTVTVPEEITNGTVTVTCGTEGIEITKNEEDGTYAVTLPEGRATYTFTATLTAGTLEDGTAYDSAEATCTVRVGSRPATSTTPTTPSETTSTQVKEDGTKITTVTKPDGTVTETTEAPDGTVAVVETKKDGTVTETVSQPDGTKSEAITTPEGDKTITVTDPEGEEIAKVELPAEIPAPEAKFEDVAQAAPWAEEAINKVAGLKLVEGTGNNKYDPISPMTRGALATVLHRLSQGKTDYEVTFQDVAAGKYYTEGVAWAAKVNVVKGLSEDVFAPEQVITREQLAVMLARYAKLIGMDTKADAKALDQFADGSATNDWAVDGVAWCVENGILQGKGADVLDPGNNVTRAEVAVMLDRFIALMK